MSADPATFATLAATAYAAHTLADHVLGQTDRQAALKATAGPAGWAALARHIGGYHLILTAMSAAAVAAFGLPISPTGAAAGLALSAATHALWDRRTPVRWVLEHTGARQFAQLADHGLNGLYLSDQALHTACLWAAALATVAL
ncbi:hypothetical protein [Pseudofrankia inefficax]|uniref:DUF3307 domain-containing protein n=1 Tax=Pseudofrankia inefficax (strain DSM 45817 / CECT 9037 / DDB 130130 / EuI1c) TaxID=298654 RepID=E3JDR0_PSEI1|nr:hypothetical protein [Pseudofrankia inefficax]ADP84826.1 hypothetical protein FraEuI1c_6857 [Pseudofrankia inefficax]